RELFDNAIPAGSSVAADVLQRLGRLTATPAWEQSGLTALPPVLGVLARAPTGFGHALGAADFALSRVREVAIVGPPPAEETRTPLAHVWSTHPPLPRPPKAEEPRPPRAKVWSPSQPNRVLAAAAPDDRAAQREIPLLADRPTL